MIYPSALQPGYCVQIGDQQYAKVLEVEGAFIRVKAFNAERKIEWSKLDGIKLDSHILSNCEFTRQDNEYYNSSLGLALQPITKFQFELYHNDEVVGTCSFLHELQELFKNTTNQPLTPNLVGI
jgi:hypothetical protein